MSLFVRIKEERQRASARRREMSCLATSENLSATCISRLPIDEDVGRGVYTALIDGSNLRA